MSSKYNDIYLNLSVSVECWPIIEEECVDWPDGVDGECDREVAEDGEDHRENQHPRPVIGIKKNLNIGCKSTISLGGLPFFHITTIK